MSRSNSNCDHHRTFKTIRAIQRSWPIHRALQLRTLFCLAALSSLLLATIQGNQCFICCWLDVQCPVETWTTVTAWNIAVMLLVYMQCIHVLYIQTVSRLWMLIYVYMTYVCLVARQSDSPEYHGRNKKVATIKHKTWQYLKHWIHWTKPRIVLANLHYTLMADCNFSSFVYIFLPVIIAYWSLCYFLLKCVCREVRCKNGKTF